MVEYIRSVTTSWAPKYYESTGIEAEDMKEHSGKLYYVGTPGSSRIHFNPVVTALSAGGIWAFVIWAMVAQKDAMEATLDAQSWVTDVWNWIYMASQNIWIVVLIYLLYAHYNLKLGKDGDKPEFSDATYFAMLFSCGVATGLWYFTAEGMWHYEGYGTPRWMDKEMFNMNTRAEHALMVTFFHWGLHGWIPYTVVGALIAILTYRRGFPMSMRWTLYPVIGEMCYGFMGDLVDVMSILCTVFGVCTSLGLGAGQINKGMVRLDRGTWHGKDFQCINADGTHPDPTGMFQCEGNMGMEVTVLSQIIIIILITLFATLSVVAGLKAGIATLSQIAFGLSFFIIVSILLMDETWYILNALTSTFGYYIWYLPKIAFHTDAWEELGSSAMGIGGAPDDEGGKKGWMNGWTIFYWGWWISWGPFVGTFLARISKGRTLGNFILATLILPSLWSFIFMGIFGASQIRISNQAMAAGLNGSGFNGTGGNNWTYGLLANKSAGQVGYYVPTGNTITVDGKDVAETKWQPVPDQVTRLYMLATEDVLFEHLQYYGGRPWGTFMTVICLICIILYFITSSDSASFVVDIIAANGQQEPPLPQKIFWAFTEGACAAALLASAGDDGENAALKAVKALPIILGLPYTFLLFWMCQGLLIVCREEAEIAKLGCHATLDDRKWVVLRKKNFSEFFLNIQPASFVAIFVPFVPLGKISKKVFGGGLAVPTVGWFLVWLVVVIFLALTAADEAFAKMGGAAYLCFGLGVGGLRVAFRTKCGITGDMISDALVCTFAMPFAIGQMDYEEMTDSPQSKADMYI